MKLPILKNTSPKAHIKINPNLIDMINRNFISSRCLIIINSSPCHHIHSILSCQRFPGRRFRLIFGRSPFSVSFLVILRFLFSILAVLCLYAIVSFRSYTYVLFSVYVGIKIYVFVIYLFIIYLLSVIYLFIVIFL